MLNLTTVFEQVTDGFNDRSLSQDNLIAQVHQGIFHVLLGNLKADASNFTDIFKEKRHQKLDVPGVFAQNLFRSLRFFYICQKNILLLI